MILSKNKISLFVVLALSFYIVSFPFLNGWGNPFTWDTFGYYLYLPMAFIYHDLGIQDFSVIENLREQQFISTSLYQLNRTETGSWLIRYPSGLAVLLSPFYLLGHWAAKWSGYSQNGFSLPYQIAIVSGCLFYITSSFFLLRKILLSWFSDKVVAITIVIVCAGTNYLHQATVNTAMPHTLLFFLYTLIVLFTIKWHEKKTMTNSILLGATIGLATICRPIEIISICIPVFWEVKNWSALKAKFQHIWTHHLLKLIGVLASGLAVVCIQMLYWKISAGYVIYNSYQNPGEGLDLLFPHIVEVLFSFKKGWFIYTPVIIFAFVGFYFLKKKKPQLFLSVFIFTVFNLYLVSSWTCWWYAHSFGQRALVQSYVVLAIGLGFFIQAMLKFNLSYKLGVGLVLVSLVGLNLFQIEQSHKGIIHGDRMTKEAYKYVFGKLNVDKEKLETLLSYNRDLSFEEAKVAYSLDKTIDWEEDFEDKEDQGIIQIENNKVLRIGKELNRVYWNEWQLPYKEFTKEELMWVEVSFKAKITDANSRTRVVMNIKRNKNGDSYGYRSEDLVNHKKFEINKWKNYTYYYLTPYIRNRKDFFQTYFWYDGGEEVLIDDIQISHFQVK